MNFFTKNGMNKAQYSCFATIQRKILKNAYRAANNSPSISLTGKFYYLLIPMQLCFLCANAQVKTTPVALDIPPTVHNMAEYAQTPKATKRKVTLSKPQPPKTKDLKFQDGSVIHVKLDKSDKAPEIQDAVTKTISKKKDPPSGGYDCTTTVVNLSATSDSFLNNDYSGSTDNIYPGACYTYDNLTNGKWQAQQGVRNTITVTTDNPNMNGKSYINVQNPNIATIEYAVSQLFSRMKKSTGNESLTYQVTDAENSAAYNLQVGAAASGYGVDLSNVYSTGNSSTHAHMTIDATKTLFTISTFPPDSGFYKDPKVEATPYLSFIGEVSYGVRVLANVDMTFNSQSEADNFKASISDIGITASLGVNYGNSSSATNTTINGYMIGGPGNQVVAYSLKDLKSQIEKAFANASYQNARPIKYKAFDMSGSALNTYSATDNFAIQNCVPADGGSPQIQNIIVSFQQGGDGKDAQTQFTAYLYPEVAFKNGQIPMLQYSTYTVGTTQFANNGSAFIVLTPDKDYKGECTMETLQKAGGGRIIIGPIAKGPHSTLGWDEWDITAVKVTINLKATPDNPNAQGGPPPITYSFSGPNPINLRTGPTNTALTLAFDRNFKAVQ